jgi:putative heme-binding domain-containing protein
MLRHALAASALVLCAALALPAFLAAQAPADAPYPGSGLARQRIFDTLTSASPGTRPSVDAGKALFEKTCAGCHIFGDIGASVGPDLSTVGARFGRREILDSILWPSHTISDQYVMTTFELVDGTSVSGLVARENTSGVAIRNGEHLERPLVLPAASIKERTESPISLMPEHLVADMTLDQIDSLVTFLLTGK